MSKSILLQDPAISRDQLREQIRQSVKDAQMAAEEAAKQAAQSGRTRVVTVPVPPTPPGIPTVGVRINGEQMIPPQAETISIAFFITIAVIIIGLPIMRAIARRIERGAPVAAPIPAEVRDQLQQISQLVDAIAIEVERISEGQRFASKLLAEQSKEREMTRIGPASASPSPFSEKG